MGGPRGKGVQLNPTICDHLVRRKVSGFSVNKKMSNINMRVTIVTSDEYKLYPNIR